MTFGNIIRLSRLAHLAAALALIAFAIPASAATPIFPTGSRVGLIPPAGMVLSRTFSGFEDPDKKAVILISSMPAAAYAEIETSLADEVLKKQQFTVDKREPIEFSFGKGFLISGKVVIENQRYRKWLLAGAGRECYGSGQRSSRGSRSNILGCHGAYCTAEFGCPLKRSRRGMA